MDPLATKRVHVLVRVAFIWAALIVARLIQLQVIQHPKFAEMAREQGALSWELRIGLSLCRLRATQGRGGEARPELASLYDRFTEGFGTTDLEAAKQLLDELSTPDHD